MHRIVITGVSRGIGRELAVQSVAQSHQVFGTVRQGIDGDIDGVTIISGVELTNQASIDALCSRVGQSVDLLINNAAIFEPDDWQHFDSGTARRQFEINALAPIEVTRSFLPLMKPGSKIVMISSQSASIGNARLDDNISYRMSKVALNMAGRLLANALRERGILLVMIHPGSVVTRMNPEGDISASLSAQKILATIARIDMSMTGSFITADGDRLPW